MVSIIKYGLTPFCDIVQKSRPFGDVLFVRIGLINKDVVLYSEIKNINDVCTDISTIYFGQILPIVIGQYLVKLIIKLRQ